MTRGASPEARTLADHLNASGHETTSCGWCGRTLAADLDHSEAPLNSHNRAYCTRDCARAARNHRRTSRRVLARRPEAVAARALRAALTHRHELEAAGQLDLTGLPLPDLEVTA